MGLILIPLAVLGLVSWTAWRFWLILPFAQWGKWLLTGLYLLGFLSIFLHYALEKKLPLWLGTVTYEFSTSWMIFFFYAVLVFAVLGVGRLMHLVPGSFLKDSLPGSVTVLGILTATLLFGGIHYRHKYREVMEIHTQKVLERPITVVLASDLHLGYHNRKAELARWVDLINAEEPDLVLFGGDIVDSSLRPIREGKYAGEFRRLQAPAYACLGNHEYIGGEEGSEAFYADAGITLLRDATCEAAGIRVIGRDDRSNRQRASVADLAVADSLFTLLLDHQPYHLEEAEQAGIDFQFSGHTHHGQVWPLNRVTDAMYEKAFGAHQRGNTRYYISSGLGIWGGKFRIGTRSEYLVLHIQ